MDLQLKKLNKPTKGDVDQDINWLCHSFGLCSGRDTQYTSKKIVAQILDKASEKEEVKSEGIAYDLGLSQGLVNHHLRSLISSGIIIRDKKRIYIRGGSLKQAVREIKREAIAMFEDIEDMAEEIDQELGLESR